MPPRPHRLCAPQIVHRTRIVRRALIVRRAQIVRRAEAEPPSTMMLSHFSGGNPEAVGELRSKYSKLQWKYMYVLRRK